MNIVFRCDASLQIGTGHVMRCLTLANALNQKGHKCTFICKAHAGHLIEKIRQSGHQAYALAVDIASDKQIDESTYRLDHSHWLGSSQAIDATQCQQLLSHHTVDWLIVDHYALDYEWESRLRAYAKRIMVIDDLADRAHECDLLLDQNVGRTKEEYSELVSEKCHLLIGTNFCLLREQFDVANHEILDKSITNSMNKIEDENVTIFIYFGGSDPKGLTLNFLSSCVSGFDHKYQFEVVVGSGNKDLLAIQQLCRLNQYNLSIDVENIASIILRCDVAIVACGFICYELASLKTPAIYIATSAIQLKVSKTLESIGIGISIDYQKYRKYDYNELINKALNTEFIAFESFRADGTQNVIRKIEGL